MLLSEIIKKVVEEKSALLIKEINQEMVKGDTFQYDVKPLYPNLDELEAAGDNQGWVILDLFTASAMFTVLSALKPENQPKWDTLSLNKLIDFTWKHVK